MSCSNPKNAFHKTALRLNQNRTCSHLDIHVNYLTVFKCIFSCCALVCSAGLLLCGAICLPKIHCLPVRTSRVAPPRLTEDMCT